MNQIRTVMKLRTCGSCPYFIEVANEKAEATGRCAKSLEQNRLRRFFKTPKRVSIYDSCIYNEYEELRVTDGRTILI